jgi:hypothetical protein
MTDKYRTISELAAELRLSYSAIWNHVQAGSLDALQMGGAHTAIRIPAKSYRDFLAKSRKSGDAAEMQQENNNDIKTG